MAAFPAREGNPFLEHWSRTLADPDVVARAVVVDGQVVGNVVSFPADGRREVGYRIGLLVEVPVRPLHAWVARHNIASRRVLERSGFAMVTGPEDAGPAEDAEGFTFELP